MENQPSISSDLIRGHIDTIILHSLMESDKFAQQISDDVELKSDGEYKINQATLYSSLKRLESLKLVSSYWHDFEGGRRKFFNITEYGRKTVEDNLSSWVYSRSIIDKLMNLSPDPVIVEKPVVVEKEVVIEKPVYVEKVVTKEVFKSPDTPIEATNIEPVVDETQTEISQENEQKAKITEQAEQVERENNFRNILNGLISLSAPKQNVEHENKRENIPLEPIVSVSGENAKPTIQKFNATINETDYNANKTNFNGKIDYGDLTLKAEKEGYAIRISSKDSAKPTGNILINKLNFFSMLIVFLFVAVEIGVLYLTMPTAFDVLIVKILSAVAIIPLIVFAVLYSCKRYALFSKKITADGILIAAIIAFNLILLNFAFDFIFEIDLEDTPTLLAALVIPIIYYANFVVFFLLRFILAPKKAFFYK